MVLHAIDHPERTYIRSAVTDLLPLIDQGQFRAGAEGIFVASPGGRLPMPDIRFSRGDRSRAIIQKPLYMPAQLQEGFPRDVLYPEMRIARLRNVTCLYGGIYITADGHVLDDSFFSTWDEGPHWHLSKTEKGDHGWSLNYKGDHTVTRSLRTGFLLDFQCNQFLGHFYADALSRAWAIPYARAYLGVQDLTSAISISGLFMDPFMDALSISRQTIANPVAAIHFDELIISSKSLQIQEYVAPASSMIWDFIKHSFRAAYENSKKIRLYISRKYAPNRRLVNEQDVEDLFNTKGYVTIYPETMPIQDQVRLFSSAEAIAGCSGTNMFNLAFARTDCDITILVSPRLIHFSEMFFSYRNTSGMNIFVGDDLHERPGDVHAPWSIDIDALRTFLKEGDGRRTDRPKRGRSRLGV